MKSISRTVLFFFALTVLAGCASTNVTQQTPTTTRGSHGPIGSGSTTSSRIPPRCPPIPLSGTRSARRARHRRLSNSKKAVS